MENVKFSFENCTTHIFTIKKYRYTKHNILLHKYKGKNNLCIPIHTLYKYVFVYVRCVLQSDRPQCLILNKYYPNNNILSNYFPSCCTIYIHTYYIHIFAFMFLFSGYNFMFVLRIIYICIYFKCFFKFYNLLYLLAVYSIGHLMGLARASTHLFCKLRIPSYSLIFIVKTQP